MSIPNGINIRGIHVRFPFEPYQCQISYMESVIESLQEGHNALLESPTGTGKTLCLLTSTLAWREQKKKQFEEAQLALEASLYYNQENNDDFDDYGHDYLESEVSNHRLKLEEQVKNFPRAPTIIYASRTHSQLSQVLKEFNRTSYTSSLKVCVLGSRSQLCIHPAVSQVRGGVSAINRACNTYVQKNECQYHSNSELYKMNLPSTKDIEDLISWGRRNSACPYYIAKEQQNSSDIIFMPYNYIIDPLIRKSLSMELNGAIVILDEAHNIESVANDAASFEFSVLDLKTCISQINQCIDLLVDHNPTGLNITGQNADVEWTQANIEDAKLLKENLSKLLAELTQFTFPIGLDTKSYDGKYMFDMFARNGINHENANLFLKIVEKIAFFANETAHLVQVHPEAQPEVLLHGVGANMPVNHSNSSLNLLAESLRKMFFTGLPIQEQSQHFKTVFQRESSNMKQNNDNSINNKRNQSNLRRSIGQLKVSFWCFYPGVAMKSLMSTGIRSLILTSGTLSPLDSFAYELGIPFEVRLENPHVIPSSQIWIGILSTSVDGIILNSSYENRNDQYKMSLGRTLSNIARITPGGLLVFFPSYSLMEESILLWKEPSRIKQPDGSVKISSDTIWDSICKYKLPVQEPRDSKQLRAAINDFCEKVDAKPIGEVNGAVFFAVCRGKVSEGLDFSDNYGRTVVVTGLPFPTVFDQKVKLKKEYLNNQADIRRNASKNSSLNKDFTKSASIANSNVTAITNQPSNTNNNITSSSNQILPQFSSSHSIDAIESSEKASKSMIPLQIKKTNHQEHILTGDEWYNQNAWRAVNQAIGRVIRHRHDYGAIIFADDRFSNNYYQLSKWLRPYVQKLDNPGKAFHSLKQFFNANSKLVDVASQIETSNPLSLNEAIKTANAATPSLFERIKHKQSPPESKRNPSATETLKLFKTLPNEVSQKFQKLIREYRKQLYSYQTFLQKAENLLAPFPEVCQALKNIKSPSNTSTTENNNNNDNINDNNAITNNNSTSNSNNSNTNNSNDNLINNNLIDNNDNKINKNKNNTAPESIPIVTNNNPISNNENTSIDDLKDDNQQEDSTSSKPQHVDLSIDISAPTKTKTEKTRPFSDISSPVDTPSPKRMKAQEAIVVDLEEPSSITSSNNRPTSLQSTPFKTTLSGSPRPTSAQPILLDEEVIHSDDDIEAIESVPAPVDVPESVVLVSSSSIPVISQTITIDEHQSPPQLLRVQSSPLRTESSIISPMRSNSPGSESWIHNLQRTASGGNMQQHQQILTPIANKQRVVDSVISPASNESPYKTPQKKTYVNLLTGRIETVSASRPAPKRVSPEKVQQVEILTAAEDEEEENPLNLSVTECPICSKPSTDIKVAQCGHSCCNACWQGWLTQKLECPFCRGRVRAKKLISKPKSK